MYVIMDSKAAKHSWHYNLCLLLFLMVTSTSQFMMISLGPVFRITIGDLFLLKWLGFYNLSMILSIIVFSMIIRVNSRSLKYALMTMSGLLILNPIVLVFCCEAYLKCSYYSLGVLNGFVQGYIYMSLIQFMRNSKFTGRYTWPALMFVDIPSTLFYILTVNSIEITPSGFIIALFYAYFAMSIVLVGIIYIIIRIERYEKCMGVSHIEKRIMEEIVVERRLSNCSTSIESSACNDSIIERICYSIKSIRNGMKEMSFIIISTVSFSLPIPFLINLTENEEVIPYYIMISGIVRVMCLTIPFISKNLMFGSITAGSLTIFSYIYLTMPLLISFFNKYYGSLMMVFLGLSGIVHSIIICGVLSNWFNSLTDNTSDKRKNSFISMVVLASVIGNTMGISTGYIINQMIQIY